MQMVQRGRGAGLRPAAGDPAPAGGHVPARARADRRRVRLAEAGRPPRAHPGLQLGLGAENFWDDVLLGRLQSGGLPSYDGGPAFLFEINPALMPRPAGAGAVRAAAGRAAAGDGPSRAVPGDPAGPARAEALGRTAALVVDLGALDGAHGRAEMKTARRLVEEGLAHAAATDIHSPDDQRSIAAGMAWIRKRLGDQALSRLLDQHPRHILAGELALNLRPHAPPTFRPDGRPPPGNSCEISPQAGPGAGGRRGLCVPGAPGHRPADYLGGAEAGLAAHRWACTW